MDISKMKMIPFMAISNHVMKGNPIRGMVSLRGIMLATIPVYCRGSRVLFTNADASAFSFLSEGRWVYI